MNTKCFAPIFLFITLMLSSCVKDEVTTEQAFVKSDEPATDGGSGSGSSSSGVLFLEDKSSGFVPPDMTYSYKCTIKENGEFEYKHRKGKNSEQVITGQIAADLIEDMKQYIDEILVHELYKVDNIRCTTDGPQHTTEVLNKGAKHFINVTKHDFSTGNCAQIDIQCMGNSTDKLYEIVNDHCKI